MSEASDDPGGPLIPGDLEPRYVELLPKYERRTKAYRELVAEILESRGLHATIEDRTKKANSFMRKALEITPPYANPLEDMHDISGLRLIALAGSDVDQIVEALREELEVDEDRSFDKGADYSSDQFGYKSRHVVCRVTARLGAQPKWRDLPGHVEIQVRTECQHAWAQVDRLVRYKTAKEPTAAVQRRIFSLAAVLEVCDKEIEGILASWQDAIDLAVVEAAEAPETALSTGALAGYLQGAPLIKELTEALTRHGIEVTGLGRLHQATSIALHAGIGTTGALNRAFETVGSSAADLVITFVDQVATAGLRLTSIDRGAIVSLIVIATCRDQFSATQLRDHYGFGLGWAAIAAAKALSS